MHETLTEELQVNDKDKEQEIASHESHWKSKTEFSQIYLSKIESKEFVCASI